MPGTTFRIAIEQVEDCEFRVRLDRPPGADLMVDAPAPFGREAAPSPSRLLAAAVGHCAASVLVMRARKAGVALGPVEASVCTRIVWDDLGRPRIGGIDVEIDPHIPVESRAEAARAFENFAEMCMVTESVRQGIDVAVRVRMPE